MPYKIIKRGDEYCVIKINTDSSEETIPGGCHNSKIEAERHRAAIGANKAKNLLLKFKNDSAMIAFDVTNLLPRKLTDLYRADEYHITLIYLGKVHEIKLNEQLVINYLSEFAKIETPLYCNVQGCGEFWNTTEDEQKAIWLNVEGLKLQSFRQRLLDKIPVPQTYGFTPHITLKYVDKTENVCLPNYIPFPIYLNQLWLSWGTNNYYFNLNDQFI